MPWLLGAFAIIAGISNPLQSGSNATLNKVLAAPVASAFLVYAVGGLCLLACIPFLGFAPRGTGGKLAGLPWWVFIGGACNALFLMSTLLVTKKLGSATFTTIVVIAAVITSLMLDNFGLLGFAVRPLTALRLLGGALAIAGVVLIALF